jgi:hypothetical protein
LSGSRFGVTGSLFLFTLVSGCSRPPEPPPQPVPALTAQGYGSVVLGMPMEAPDACSYVRPPDVPSGPLVMVVEGRVRRIDVIEAGIVTAEGIGVGSSEANVRSAYPAATPQPHKYEQSGRYLVVPVAGDRRCRRKFLRFFPSGFVDETYLEWERDYKWETHRRWEAELGKNEFRRLVRARQFSEVAARAVRVEQRSRHSMIFSFEKMALRDAVKSADGARAFAEGLYAFLHGDGHDRTRFEEWCEAVASLPRRQTRVLTWPLVTVFGFIAQPARHMFLKPTVTRAAAAAYGVRFDYISRPNWDTYRSLLEFAEQVRRDQRDLRPRDMIDLQSFIWVQGSDEYA